MLKLLDRIVGMLIDGFGLASGLIIAFMAVSISAEVIVRSAGGAAFGWTLELCEYGLLVVSFLGAPWVLRHSDHIRVDVVLRSVSAAPRHVMFTVANAIAAATCAVVAYHAAIAALDAYRQGAMLYKDLVIPQWWILSILPVGLALMAIEFLSRTLRRLAGEDIPEERLGGGAL